MAFPLTKLLRRPPRQRCAIMAQAGDRSVATQRDRRGPGEARLQLGEDPTAGPGPSFSKLGFRPTPAADQAFKLLLIGLYRR